MNEMLKTGQIGSLNIRNRIVMLPMGTRYADEQGFVTERMIDYYQERARGGAGLVIVEVTCVDSPRGNLLLRNLVIDDDKYIPGLSKLAAAIKKHGARAAIQLGHAGNATMLELTGGVQPVAPSALKRDGLYDPARELSIAEIGQLVDSFAKAAERAKHAGFDAVELHCAHFYLISQFLSGAWNKRQDIYGGELKNRARFLMEILKAVRAAVGLGLPVWCRINGEEENVPEGTTLTEAKQTAQMIQVYIDALSVSAASKTAATFLKTSPDHPGANLHLAQAIKEVVDIPVIAAGRMTPELGNEAIEKGMADFIGIGRGLICDPALPNKVAEGRFDDIRPCIACLRCYSETEPMTCSVNASAGKEAELRIRPAAKPGKILVVGGGPAGMEAARTAALMGHGVVLMERSQELGGQLLLAAVPPEKKEMIEPLTAYMKNQVSKLGIDVRLSREADLDTIKRESPEAIILATGMNPFLPNIPGMGGHNVFQAVDVIAGLSVVGEKVAVIGGGLIGCETADILAGQGKKVVIVEMRAKMAANMPAGRRRALLKRLARQGVSMVNQATCDEVINQGVIIIDQDGAKQFIEADSVVVASGSRPDRVLTEGLQRDGMNIKILQAGDCICPRGILEAIEDGFRAAIRCCTN